MAIKHIATVPTTLEASDSFNMIRLLIADQIQGDFSVRLQYISTYLNTDADALSRGDVGTVMRRREAAVIMTPDFPRELPTLAAKWIPSQ